MMRNCLLVDPFSIDCVFDNTNDREHLSLMCLKSELEGYDFIDVSDIVSVKDRLINKNFNVDIGFNSHFMNKASTYPEMVMLYKDFYQITLIRKRFINMVAVLEGNVRVKLELIRPSGLILIKF